MKFFISVLIATVTMLFSGCAVRTEPIPPAQYSNYPALYEVNYDLQCGRFVFKNGERFAPLELKGQTIRTIGLNSSDSKLPEYAIGLKIHEQLGFANRIENYALIKPDGEFLSDQIHFLVWIIDPLFEMKEFRENRAICQLQKGMPLFKLVKLEEVQ